MRWKKSTFSHTQKMIVLFLWFFFGITNIQSEEISLIWQISDSCWEWDWVREIFQNVDYREIKDGNFTIVKDRAIIVIGHSDKLDGYLSQFKSKNYTYGIVHIADETYSNPTQSYENAAFVYRNYWHKKYVVQPQVKCFPLGYKTGFWKNYPKQIKEARNRKYTWSFAGQINKSTRQDMISNLKKISKHFIYETQSFADPQALSTEKYRNLLLDSIFVPCPRGFWNLDSFRVYEALECGCIPIVEKQPLDYFTKFYGNHPFLSVNSWNEAPSLLQHLLNHPELLEQVQKDCYKWWKEYKRNLQNEVAEVVRSTF